MDSLLSKGAITYSDSPGFFSQIFVIPKKSGGFRLIINLKLLNKFITYKHFKMERLNTLTHLIREEDWFAKIDLQDAYLTVQYFLSIGVSYNSHGKRRAIVLHAYLLVWPQPRWSLQNFCAQWLHIWGKQEFV